jgi:hypothetical protein
VVVVGEPSRDLADDGVEVVVELDVEDEEAQEDGKGEVGEGEEDACALAPASSRSNC